MKVVSVLITLAFLSGCATPPEKISSSYVSPLQYQNFSCKQIGAELLRVNRKILEITKVQHKEADKDAAAMGVGMILFWPALFFMIGEDKKEELARLKGECEALESAAIQKECELTKELEEIHKQREKYEEERKELMESTIDGREVD